MTKEYHIKTKSRFTFTAILLALVFAVIDGFLFIIDIIRAVL